MSSKTDREKVEAALVNPRADIQIAPYSQEMLDVRVTAILTLLKEAREEASHPSHDICARILEEQKRLHYKKALEEAAKVVEGRIGDSSWKARVSQEVADEALKDAAAAIRELSSKEK